MPPLRPPTRLQDRAMEVLIDFFMSSCVDCQLDPVKPRRNITFMGNEIRHGLPLKLAADFCNKVLKKIEPWIVRYGREHLLFQMAMEIVMDKVIVGLDCPTRILELLRQKEVDRIRGITRLKLEDKLPYSLNKMHLEHLTEFEYRERCTDSDLRVIGGNCPKLNRVDVSKSQAVTDVGLAALASCPDLQFLSVSNCRNVSASGLNNFLSVHKSIRHLLTCGPESRYGGTPGFDFRTDKNWRTELTVHESLESFTIMEGFTDRHLLHLVRRFPNLRSIEIDEGSTVNLSIIKSLSKLSKIDFSAGHGTTWANFESLLELFGPQIDELRVQCRSFNIVQRGIESMFRLCENLEILAIECYEDPQTVNHQELVIPPFKNLRVFSHVYWCYPKLKVSRLPKLECLKALECDVVRKQFASIILDHTHFPNLKEIHVRGDLYSKTRKEDTARLKHIIKTNNLDVMIRIGF